jgi:beta-lactamase class A
VKTLILLAALLAVTPALAEDTPLQQKANEICALFRADPSGLERLFTPAFLAQVPAEKLSALTRSMVAQYGRCTSMRVVKADGALQGEVAVVMEKGYEARAQLVIEEPEPHLVSGLLIRPPSPQLKSLAEVVAKLKALPGVTSLLVTPLGGGKPLIVWNEEKPLGVGSAFKLWVLVELARQVEGGRRLEETVPLKDEWKSLPSGILQEWPSGSPVTLASLATLMISRSDNTATDHLVMILGRESIEQGLAAAGHRHVAGMRPFLTTFELFRLKLLATAEERARWAKAKEAEKRRILTELGRDARPLSSARMSSFSRPIDITALEWFASTGDLCRVMDKLRQTPSVRPILAVNPGLPLDKEKWPFIGFKGGSEPGVLNLTFLLERKDGKAYCVAATWNDAKDPVLDETLAGLVITAISLIP